MVTFKTIQDVPITEARCLLLEFIKQIHSKIPYDLLGHVAKKILDIISKKVIAALVSQLILLVVHGHFGVITCHLIYFLNNALLHLFFFLCCLFASFIFQLK